MLWTPEQIRAEFGQVDVQSDRVDVIDGYLYDQVVIAASTSVDRTNAKFFASKSTKTIRQTNMPQEGMLPIPEMFSIHGIGFYFPVDTSSADARALLNNLALVLELRNTQKFTAPLHKLASGGGLVPVDTTATTDYFSNGLQTRQAQHVMAVPIVIPSQTKYAVYLDGTAFNSTAQITMEVVLSGLYLKGA